MFTVEDENSEAVKKLAIEVLRVDPKDENFSATFNRLFHFSSFSEEEKLRVRSGVKRFLLHWKLTRFQTEKTRLAGAWGVARQAKEDIAPLH